MMPTRRTFLAASGISMAGGLASAFGANHQTRSPICVFTKPFNSLSFDDLASSVTEIGFDGIEAPIRRGGHIEPEAVPDLLPQLVSALKKHNSQITVLTSDINDPSAAVNESVLRTAAKLGIRFYRMKYFRYAESRPVRAQITEWKSKLRDLAALNRELGMTAVYQNHAGNNYFGASIWDLHLALEGIDPNEIGVAYDIRHATAEAGMSWPVGFRLIRPHIKVVYVKDFVWGEKRPTNVPLGSGRVQDSFFRMLATSAFTGPISLHEEYLDHRKPELVPDHWTAIRTDFATLQKKLEQA